MKLLLQYTILIFAFLLAARIAAQDEDNSGTPAERYQALIKEFQGNSIYFRSTNEIERQTIMARIDKATEKLLELAEQHPREPFALDALTQVISEEYWLNTYSSRPGSSKESQEARAMALVLRDHLESDKLGDICRRVHFGFRQECETFLRTVLAKSPHREVRGEACLRLAQFLAGQMEQIDVMKGQPEMAKHYDELFGKGYLDRLRARDRAQAMKEAEALYEQANKEYGDVKLPYDETVGVAASADLFEIRHLAIGKVAPEIEGADQDGQPLKLSDYRGKAVLLYFWSEF